jgi:hypothetical protein
MRAKGDVMLSSVPLIAILVIAYNVIVFTAGVPNLDATLFTATMLSGAEFSLSVSGLLLSIGLVLLFVEVVKSVGTGTTSVINHALSMLVFIICIIEFITVERAGNTTFFLITMMALLDIIAGFTVTIITARRDFTVTE